eukprot:365145-Chlamydomonas_euryale.AAC.17
MSDGRRRLHERSPHTLAHARHGRSLATAARSGSTQAQSLLCYATTTPSTPSFSGCTVASPTRAGSHGRQRRSSCRHNRPRCFGCFKSLRGGAGCGAGSAIWLNVQRLPQRSAGGPTTSGWPNVQ